MDKFWELLEDSVIIQGVIAIAFVFTTCYLAAASQPIPDIISTALTFVLGYFFGQKSQQAIAKTMRKLNGRAVDSSGGADSTATD